MWQSEREVAPPKASFQALAEVTCHEVRGWSNLLAYLNKKLMSVTLPVCHEFRGWLNEVLENIQRMFVTEPTCHESTSWSNFKAV